MKLQRMNIYWIYVNISWDNKVSQIENLSCHLLLRNISIKICLKSDLKQHFMLIFIDDGFFEALIWSDVEV